MYIAEAGSVLLAECRDPSEYVAMRANMVRRFWSTILVSRLSLGTGLNVSTATNDGPNEQANDTANEVTTGASTRC